MGRIAEHHKDTTAGKIFKIIDRCTEGGAKDSTDPVSLPMDAILAVKDLSLEHVRGEYAKDAGGFQTLDEARHEAPGRVKAMVSAMMERNYAKDGFNNPVTGFGTAIDPAMYSTASIPLSISPDEATGIYASGGIPAEIIDRKSESILLNGYTFDGLEKGDAERLKDHAESVGFGQSLKDSCREGHLYGGSLLIPHLVGDTPISYLKSYAELLADKTICRKGCIDRFWTADRWNAVLVPDYNLSAESYLNPKSFFIPLAGLEVKTSRLAIIRPKKLPFWGTIRLMGWGAAEPESWMRSIFAYEQGISAIPTMAMQISLMYSHIPIDGLLAQNGAAFADEYAEKNARRLAEWSILSPKLFSNLGEIKILERTYTGFDELIKILQEDIGAKSEISHNILFHQQPEGFSDNDKEVDSVQAEISKRIANVIAPQLKNVVRLLAISCFGPDSPQAQNPNLRINFNPPQMITNDDRVEQGKAFAEVFFKFVESGLPGKEALVMTRACIPTVEVPNQIETFLAMHDGGAEGQAPEGSGMLAGLGSAPAAQPAAPAAGGGFLKKLFGGRG